MRRGRNSERLKARLDLLVAPAAAASDALWGHPRLVELVPELLVMLHHTVRASVPLMEAGRDRALRLADHDAVAAQLAAYLGAHIPEERDHDLWLLADLAAIGVPRAEVLRLVPPPTVAALVGSQYYWILHAHPVALLGYIAVLEGYPASAARLARVIARTGLPRAAFRTLLEHADLDREHRHEVFRVLDRMPLTLGHAELTAVSGCTTLHLLTRALEELLEGHRPRRARPRSRQLARDRTLRQEPPQLASRFGDR